MILSKEQQAIQTLWDYMRLGHALKKADFILVPGCYDPDCAVYAAHVYHQNYAPYIVVSGGVKPPWHDKKYDGMSEAAVFAQILMDENVPADKILIEDRATNTSENLWFTQELLQENNIPSQSVILVQKPSFERRLFATARHRWTDKDIMVTSRPLKYDEYFGVLVDYADGVASLLGDFQRLETYRNVHLADETIPATCWDAFRVLADAGYTKRLCEPAADTLARVAQLRDQNIEGTQHA